MTDRTNQIPPPEAAAASQPARASAEKRPVIIRTRQVRKEYQMGDTITKALRGVDIDLYRGEFVCILGPSGSGKSTLFNMIGGLDSPSSGRVFIDDVDVAQLTAVELAFLRCHKIGYIFQTYNLVHYMSALENITVPMAFAGVLEEEAHRRGMRLLEMVGLADRWHFKPIEMSGGQQQRTAIARAMANNPSLLLCDEPTGNLDHKTGDEIHQILKRLNTEQDVTVVCATHDHRLIDMADRIMWIRDGQVERFVNRSEVHIQKASIE